MGRGVTGQAQRGESYPGKGGTTHRRAAGDQGGKEGVVHFLQMQIQQMPVFPSREHLPSPFAHHKCQRLTHKLTMLECL